MKTTNKEIKEKEERLLSFKKEVEKLHDITDVEEYARQLAHLFLGNGLSLQTILLMAIDFGQQHPAWIPVEDYPKVDISCTLLVHYADGTIDICDYYGDYYDFTGENVTRNVTHWMPLPTPPQRKEDKK